MTTAKITTRESDVLTLLGEHLSNAEIAARLFIPPAAATLPVPLTAFVGRGGERTELTETLRTHRHVTALGPGGAGKTRLALATAEDMTGEFRTARGVEMGVLDLAPLVPRPARRNRRPHRSP